MRAVQVSAPPIECVVPGTAAHGRGGARPRRRSHSTARTYARTLQVLRVLLCQRERVLLLTPLQRRQLLFNLQHHLLLDVCQQLVDVRPCQLLLAASWRIELRFDGRHRASMQLRLQAGAAGVGGSC